MSKRVEGVEVIKQLRITAVELLELMKSAHLKAYTIGGDEVYDLDRYDCITVDANGRIREEDTRAPSREAHIVAQRRFAIYQIQKARIASGNVKPVSEFPQGWYGMSFNPPQEDNERKSYFQNLLSLFYEGECIEEMKESNKPPQNHMLLLSKRFRTQKKREASIEMADHMISLNKQHPGMSRLMLQENYKQWFKNGPAWSTFIRDMQEIQSRGGEKYKDLLPKDRPGSRKKTAR